MAKNIPLSVDFFVDNGNANVSRIRIFEKNYVDAYAGCLSAVLKLYDSRSQRMLGMIQAIKAVFKFDGEGGIVLHVKIYLQEQLEEKSKKIEAEAIVPSQLGDFDDKSFSLREKIASEVLSAIMEAVATYGEKGKKRVAALSSAYHDAKAVYEKHCQR
ncbi:MAG TPA: hypothetical protein VK254_01080 [Candidatus Bathyarchaeia archaeon]|nr:hypothetical protein [Candidatus Bathyarchaeia archaeon]